MTKYHPRRARIEANAPKQTNETAIYNKLISISINNMRAKAY